MMNSITGRLLGAAAALMMMAGGAVAQDAMMEKGPFQIRVRGLAVMPDEDADISVLGIPGGFADIETSIVPEVDISYFLTDNIALELIAAITPHPVTAKHTAIGDVDLGNTWLLPPTLLVQYHPFPDSSIRPYIGAGVNYTFFLFDDQPSGSIITDVDYEDGFGWALQAGVDIDLTDDLFLNVDVKKIFLDTEVTVNHGVATADVDIDPWIVGIGVGMRF